MRFVSDSDASFLHVVRACSGRGIIERTSEVDERRASGLRIKIRIPRWNLDIESGIPAGCEPDVMVKELAPTIDPIGEVAIIGFRGGEFA